MASPAPPRGEPPRGEPPPPPEPAWAAARRWIEQVTGKTFGDKLFRAGLENGVLLCELLSCISPGLVKKINRSPTPIAGLDNVALFLRGCREVGLKESQLFDPGDLQETSTRTASKNLDGSRKLKNVLITIYWLGKIANNSNSFNGPALNLKEFEGLLTLMRKQDPEDAESPKRSIRDSGYVDCWESERSDSLSPPRHGRDDSFDSLDSFGSRSQQTPSPDVVLRGSSDGRGSDSETDLPHRKLPDVKKDDMSARRKSYSEPKSVVPFNQYLPNKYNQTAYIPAPLRKKKGERDDFRKSWSTMSSSLGGERPFSKHHPETIEEEPVVLLEGDKMTAAPPSAKPVQIELSAKSPLPPFLPYSGKQAAGTRNKTKGPEEIRKLRSLEQAGILVKPATHRYGGSPQHACRVGELAPDILLRKENPFMWCYQREEASSEEEEGDRIPDREKDDFALRRARINRHERALPFTHFFLPPDTNKDRNRKEERKTRKKIRECSSGERIPVTSSKPEILAEDLKSKEDGGAKIPETQSHQPTKKQTQTSPSQPGLLSCAKTSITPKDKEIWNRLKVSGETSEITLSSSDGCNSSVQDACVDAQRQKSATLSEWQDNSEDELDDRFPDLERDDMMVRRFGTFQKSISPLPAANSLAICNSPVKHQRNMARHREPRHQQKAGKTESVLATDSAGVEQLCAEIFPSVAVRPMCTLEHSRPVVADLAQKNNLSVVDKAKSGHDEIHPERQKPPEINSQQLATLQDDPLQISGSRTPVSDDAESVSMFDMRCPDEGAVNQPHSKARYEKLQVVHHQLKEEEDQWQDDLARWKNRRRSASQDLLKKEAERKKMEQLLTGAGEGNIERRKSIKTYREIVEEKEKRERELHEAYKNARSQEEADHILQHYIERFTISEAVLERLEMPKLLERSHSAEPNSPSPAKDTNPLRYLRQQSLPPPKFTAKFEATIAPTGGSDARTPTGSPSSSRPPGSMAIPLVMPKPYAQPKDTREVLRNFKVDGKVTVNGEASNGEEEKAEKESSTFLFEPSPSRSSKPDHAVASCVASKEEESAGSTSTDLVPKSLIEHGVHREQVDSFPEEAEPASQKIRTNSEEMFLAPDRKESSALFSCENLTEAAHVEITSLDSHLNETGANPDVNSKHESEKLEKGEENGTEASLSQKVEVPRQGEGLLLSLVKKLPETSQRVLQDPSLQDQKAVTENNETPNRLGCWAWDPEEERRRQERWQQEQERLLQERYQKEQEKLKKEWEKAQKEVEEEERKYYEEERKILEDTVVPFMLTSSSAEALSTSSSMTDGNRTMNLIDLSYSEDDSKQNEGAKVKTSLCEQDGASFSKYKEPQPFEENFSTVIKEELVEGLNRRQKDRIPTPEERSPNTMPLPLCPDVQWNQPLPAERSPCISDTRPQDSQLGSNFGLSLSSPKEVKREASQGTSRTGPPSPRSPTTQSQTPNRSISGKKICSSCGHPLGKGAAMIIETLGLYFHIQCFRCGICKGQLGDAATGTDVRIRNGLLTCSDCYIKARSAGQPTTL